MGGFEQGVFRLGVEVFRAECRAVTGWPRESVRAMRGVAFCVIVGNAGILREIEFFGGGERSVGVRTIVEEFQVRVKSIPLENGEDVGIHPFPFALSEGLGFADGDGQVVMFSSPGFKFIKRGSAHGGHLSLVWAQDRS